MHIWGEVPGDLLLLKLTNEPKCKQQKARERIITRIFPTIVAFALGKKFVKFVLNLVN